MPPIAKPFLGLLAGLAASAVAGGFEAGAVETSGPGAGIYLRGEGIQPVTAYLAGGSVKAPGRLFPCVNCHKADGLGVVEGGLKPRDITWPALMRPANEQGRGYDEMSVRRAIRDGIDPQGQPLGKAMPRYAIKDSDLDAVVDYLRTFNEAASPGVSGEDVRIAVLLPLNGRQAETGRVVERFLNLAIRDINTRRRFDGRRITLVNLPFDADISGDALRAVRQSLAERPPFGFLAATGIGADDPVQDFLAREGIPNLAPLTAPDNANDRRAIWLEPSITDQAIALAEFATADGEKTPARLALIASPDTGDQAAARSVRTALDHLNATLVLDATSSEAPALLVGRLRQANAGAVLFFGPFEDAASLLNTAASEHWHPVLMGRSQQLERFEQDRQWPQRADIYLVTSYGGVDPRSRGAYDFRRVVGELGGGHPEQLRDAYVGAKLLEAALAENGRHLTRSRFLATLASFRDFATGILPPLSFGADASRRQEALVMQLDPDRGRLMPLASPDRP